MGIVERGKLRASDENPPARTVSPKIRIGDCKIACAEENDPLSLTCDAPVSGGVVLVNYKYLAQFYFVIFSCHFNTTAFFCGNCNPMCNSEVHKSKCKSNGPGVDLLDLELAKGIYKSASPRIDTNNHLTISHYSS